MIRPYVEKFIDNLPDDFKNNKAPLKIDLILDGGLFNGSYLVGALYFLKEMEKRNYVKVCRVSGCSIGSVVALLYVVDSLDVMEYLYNVALNNFKNNYNLNEIKNLSTLLKNKIPETIDFNVINKKLYITYNNVKKCKKVVKSFYKNNDDIINTIIKSCYIPFLIDGHILYEKKYMDGMTPHIFTPRADRKILYLDLFGYDKLKYLINVKNENTNFHRVLTGLLDIHNFYIKQSNTDMCSYVNDWTPTNKFHNFMKKSIEHIIIVVMYITVLIKKYIPHYIQNCLIYKIITKIFAKIIYEIYVILLENYCL